MCFWNNYCDLYFCRFFLYKLCFELDIAFIYLSKFQGGGSALMRRQSCLEHMVRGMTKVMSIPLTLKMRTGVYRDASVAHSIIEKAKLWDVSMVTVMLFHSFSTLRVWKWRVFLYKFLRYSSHLIFQ